MAKYGKSVKVLWKIRGCSGHPSTGGAVVPASTLRRRSAHVALHVEHCSSMERDLIWLAGEHAATTSKVVLMQQQPVIKKSA